MLLMRLPVTVPLKELVAVADEVLKELLRFDVAVAPLFAAAAAMSVARASPLLLICALLLSCELDWVLSRKLLPTELDCWAWAAKLIAISTAAAIAVRFMKSPPVDDSMWKTGRTRVRAGQGEHQQGRCQSKRAKPSC